MASPSPSSPLGKILDQRYRILRKLEAGGMGTVYEAEQIRLGKRVAIKVLRPEVTHDEAALRRFEREARLASRIRHRNVVELLDFGVDEDGTAFYVMELLEGRNLAALQRELGAVPWRRARSILLQITRALQAAHRLGIIHRDVKPANCFLLQGEDDDDGELVKVLDFGIAKLEPTFDAEGQLTRTSEVLGTVAYMSPEQAQSQPVDARSDVYSLGVLAYQVLTGHLPFHDDNSFNVLLQHLHDLPQPPRTLVPAIPEAIEAAILRAMEKSPADRFESMEELKAALAEVPADAIGSDTAILEPSDSLGGAATIPRELMGKARSVTKTTVLDDSATHIVPAPEVVPGATTVAPAPSEHTEIAAAPPPHPSGPVAAVPVQTVASQHPSGPVLASSQHPSGPVTPVPVPQAQLQSGPVSVQGLPAHSGPVAQQPVTGGTKPYVQMARPGKPRSDDDTLVRVSLTLVGGVLALVLGAVIAVWLVGREEETAEDDSPAAAASATDTPAEPAVTQPVVTPTPQVPTPIAPEDPMPTETDGEEPVGSTGLGAEAGPEPETPPEQTADPTPTKSGAGKPKRPTDASVKTKLRRKAKKRCGKVATRGANVRVSLSIDPGGALTLARTEAPHVSTELGKCVRTAMDGAQFPATGSRRVLSLTVGF